MTRYNFPGQRDTFTDRVKLKNPDKINLFFVHVAALEYGHGWMGSYDFGVDEGLQDVSFYCAVGNTFRWNLQPLPKDAVHLKDFARSVKNNNGKCNGRGTISKFYLPQFLI
eukprot:TRINITY_DN10093_c0_g2_i1.p1 TRINITY_DN10093_c0_g2~~TRINITY_DN10093_c0_g2_i1.p1  ORF type:complete len:111 (+),score=9.62 TRINITY_DN10093_c0_g2_i1:3-335(+)